MNPLYVSLLFLFAWVSSFLIHELMHVKGQGLSSEGTIYVGFFGFRASCRKIKYPKWFFYSGGILSGMVMLVVSYLLYLSCVDVWLWWTFLSVSMVQLCYGIYEGVVSGDVVYRHLLYVSVTCVMIGLYLYIV